MSYTHQVPSPDRALSALKQVATDLADIVKGYEVMVDRAEPELKPAVQRPLALHESHSSEVLEELGRLGGNPEDTGSVMGLVHEAVATTRDWFGGLDDSALSAILDGEDRLVESYDDAIAGLENHPDCKALLEKQSKTLRTHIDALKS